MKRLTITLAAIAATGTAAAAVPFETVEVSYEAAPRERVWDGRVEAVNQATVSAQTSGRVAELPFDVNDFVDAGEVVIRFTDTEQRAAAARARAVLEEAQARLEQAERAFERVSNMYENETVSKARFDEAKADRDSAQARLDAARSGVATADERLEYTVVRAPYAGIVSRRHVRLGELVRPGQPLISGLSLQSLRINVDVPQTMFHAVRTIGRAFVYVGDERIAADGLTFFPVADAAANTFRVRVDLPDGAATLYPGTFAKVGFVVGEAERLLVPAAAIVRRSELSAVYVVDGEAVALRQVRPGRRFGDAVEILAGVSEGERVATDPVAAGIWLKDRAGR
ncbi:MAG: efflux RND transporter periplasmic adaptor subunit [Proteobacteria bacterium]|nr:efflux RND transporter periplasmic adaptor subunit [Pseudomonadota bacterium]